MIENVTKCAITWRWWWRHGFDIQNEGLRMENIVQFHEMN